MSHPPLGPGGSVSIYDARPFFEKALLYGLQHKIIERQKLDAICQEAPKGIVQIARYFGSEFLRPELEKAKERMINLVSLQLEYSSGGDLRRAAEALRDHSFLSRSKGGSDMLKALIVMPQNSHFGMHERTGFTDEHIPQLAKWTLKNLADYQAELAKRQKVAQVIDAAIWMADKLGVDATELEEAGRDAEAVIRTALLTIATGRSEMPDWVAFDKMMAALRKKFGTAKQAETDRTKTSKKPNLSTLALDLPQDLPESFKAVVQEVRKSVLTDLPKIFGSTLPNRKLFDQTPAFMGRYFWLEDALSEVDHLERTASSAWTRATGGHIDDSSLLTLFLCVAAQSPPKTLLTEKIAATLVRKIRKTGLEPDLARQFIKNNAPEHYQEDYLRMWAEFMDEAGKVLLSDRDGALHDALNLLRHECNVSPTK